eukprot:1743935-Pleurochrysis_carterae.AAC.3
MDKRAQSRRGQKGAHVGRCAAHRRWQSRAATQRKPRKQRRLRTCRQDTAQTRELFKRSTLAISRAVDKQTPTCRAQRSISAG